MYEIIVDGGSTKALWVIIDMGGQSELLRFETPGLNPALGTEQELRDVLRKYVLPRVDGIRIERVVFYGAGCATPYLCEKLKGFISEIFPNSYNYVGSDIEGAAKALFDTERGIVCILGTGSNAAVWDGAKIIDSVPSLGYVLGDEGSANYLGRQLLNHVLKKRWPQELTDMFGAEYPECSMAEVIKNVYNSPFPNRYLGTFAPFCSKHIDSPQVNELVEDAMRQFITINVEPLQRRYPDLAIGFVGSVASAFQHVLTRLLSETYPNMPIKAFMRAAL